MRGGGGDVGDVQRMRCDGNDMDGISFKNSRDEWKILGPSE